MVSNDVFNLKPFGVKFFISWRSEDASFVGEPRGESVYAVRRI